MAYSTFVLKIVHHESCYKNVPVDFDTNIKKYLFNGNSLFLTQQSWQFAHKFAHKSDVSRSVAQVLGRLEENKSSATNI